MSRLTFSILAIGRCATQFRSEKMAPFGLKGFHISYFIQICGCPGISQDQLAQRIYINKSNVARQAAFLEEEGYITRVPSPSDKRMLQLYPTQKAMDLMPHIRQILQEWDALITDDLSEEDAQAVTAVLERMKFRAGEWMNEH